MGLRSLAEADLGIILEDKTTGFGWPITVTDPAGVSAGFTGFSDDISSVFDPDTGTMVTGRSASAALRISSLTLAGFALPVGIADASVKPWLIQFDDINGSPWTFKVSEATPDRTLGMIVLKLEAYT